MEDNRIKFNEENDNNNIINFNDNNNNINNEINKNDNKIKINKRKKKKKKYKEIKKEKETNDNIKDNIINNIITEDNNNKKDSENKSKIDEQKLKNLNNILNYNDEEINDFSYDLALKNDKRTYWKFYISLIKTKHEFIYTFLYNKDYNSKIIKIDLFIFGFALNYTINGFFFNDETMHNVYKNKGLFDLSYQLPIIVYSSFISMFLGALMQMLGLSNDSISDFKQNDEIKDINER